MHILLSHGLESGPESTKVSALARAAEARGHRALRIDYRDLDSWPARLERLLATASTLDGPILLAGSSLGAYLSGHASSRIEVAGLFLMAPPAGIDRLPPMPIRTPVLSVVHGWRDELFAPKDVLALVEPHRGRLLMVDDDHRLSASVDVCVDEFLTLLDRVWG
jgi:alpha/beta superfamily hydrolase